jgi:hypothetical protein
MADDNNIRTPAQSTGLFTNADPALLLARIGAKNKELRVQRDAAHGALKEQETKLGQLSTEIGDLKKQLEESSSSKVLELEQKIREMTHRKLFDDVARTKGIREDAINAAWQLSGYKPESDTADPAVIGAAIDGLKEGNMFLFGKAEAAAGSHYPQPPKPAPGSGQGSRVRSSTGFELPADDDPRWSDAKWQWDHSQEISDAINERLKNGQV